MLKHSRRPIIRVADTLASDLQSVSSRMAVGGIKDAGSYSYTIRIATTWASEEGRSGWMSEQLANSQDCRYAEDVAANLVGGRQVFGDLPSRLDLISPRSASRQAKLG